MSRLNLRRQKIAFTRPIFLSLSFADPHTVRYPRKSRNDVTFCGDSQGSDIAGFAGQRYRGIHVRESRTRIAGVYVLHYRGRSRAWTIGRVSSDGTRSPEITMNPNSFGLLVTCLPKRAAPTPQYHASKDKLNHGPSCHPQSQRKPARPL